MSTFRISAFPTFSENAMRYILIMCKHSKWWFSATDIVRAINDEDDYVKVGNCWRWLKKKFWGDGIQLVSVTHDFKFEIPDGKQRAAALPVIDHTLREIVGDANAPSSTILQYVFPTQKFLTLLCPKMDEQQNLIVCRTAYGKAELLPPRSKPSAITLLTSWKRRG